MALRIPESTHTHRYADGVVSVVSPEIPFNESDSAKWLNCWYWYSAVFVYVLESCQLKSLCEVDMMTGQMCICIYSLPCENKQNKS